MSGLPDLELRKRGSSLIEPFSQNRVQPSSYDLALAETLLVPVSDLTQAEMCVDLRKHEPKKFLTSIVMHPTEGYQLPPGGCLLGSTVETIHCPADHMARVEGKSSLGRLFLAVHVTAGFVDAGFSGNITLEIVNHGPWTIVLWPGMPIAQINFTQLLYSCGRPYGTAGLGSHYQKQTGPTPASGARDAEAL